MFALLIIPLLVSGYIVITTHPYHFYRLHRYDGQLLYMKSATYGVWCFFWTLLIAYIIKWLFPSFHLVMMLREQLDLKISGQGNERVIGWIILLSCGALFISWLWGLGAKKLVIYRSKLLNFIHGIDTSKVDYENVVMLRMRQELINDNPMDEIFFDSLVDRRSILVTLQNKKTYVGIVNSLGEPNEKEGPNQYISILPIISGYREKDTLKLILENEYKELKDADTSVIFPLKEVAQISWFDMETHEKVKNSKLTS
ncbi:hypothetical protein ACI51Z_00685 [Pectobacterium carotovorum]|uniref:hypothetical protein n=1 Tax=Pectobacterium TaxID=122277 RepID=UPI000CD2D2A5|nr:MULTISPECIES: hypothetical protein [Pectobacterium]MBA0177503.1 hypothetical protein [Pectobacterium carotovorum]MBA0189788.1 hypothetical protein [Pectobacterium odoriferum]POD89868.1 hypothetical protein BV925_20320 [Pectobacterium odoriferum]